MKGRCKALLVSVGLAAAAAVAPSIGSGAASSPGSKLLGEPARVFELYVRSPVLVRAGERVRLPVRVVCATAAGAPCTSSVKLGTREGSGRQWQLATAAADPALTFDLTGPASRAGAPGGSGRVDFFVQAIGPRGRTVSLPAHQRRSPSSFYAVADLPEISAPGVPFGKVRRGTTVLSLGWGSGAGHAGLEPGRESPSLGPSSFDVGAHGDIYIADALQERIAVFRDGDLVREIPVRIGPRADIAATSDGAVFLTDTEGSNVQVRRIDPSGRMTGVLSLGMGIAAQVRTDGERGLVDILPQDAWFSVSEGGPGLLASSGFTTGRPVPGGQLLRVVTEESLRLATLSKGIVRDPVEIRFASRVAEVALAEPDGAGGYWAVVHVWTSDPTPADQYQVVHVSHRHIVDTFAVGDSRFADTAPLGRFRLGTDGHLYQLMTGPNGVRIVRYELGGE